MQKNAVNTAKRPGYSTVETTLKPFNHPASGQLSQGVKVTTKLLGEFGIAESDAYEVRIAWRYLRLVDSGDLLTEGGEQLAHTSDDEFPVLLKKTLREAYGDIFDRLDPAYATPQELKEVFQNSNYEPATMRSKMFTLFRGLCRRAGIISDDRVTSHESNDHMPKDQSLAIPTNTLLPAAKENTPMHEPQQATLNDLSLSRSQYTLVEELEKQVDVLQTFLQWHKNAAWTLKVHELWEEKFRMEANKLLDLLDKK